jgi:hypothetical protein
MQNCNWLLAGVGIALLWSSQAAALTMDDSGFFDDPTYVDFDSGFPSGGFASEEIDGVVFSSGSGGDSLGILNIGFFGGFLLEATGSIQVEFTTEVLRVGFDYLAGSPIYLEAYDAEGNLLNSGDTGGVTGWGFIGFESTTTPINSLIIHDTGLTFIVDNLGFDVSGDGTLDGAVDEAIIPVPEPGAALLFSAGLFTAAASIRRKHVLR